MNNYNKLFEVNKYLTHIENKKDAAKELISILSRMNVKKLNNFKEISVVILLMKESNGRFYDTYL
jgi:hypothetical protein